MDSIIGELTELDIDRMSGLVSVPGEDMRVEIVFASSLIVKMKRCFSLYLPVTFAGWWVKYSTENIFNVIEVALGDEGAPRARR